MKPHTVAALSICIASALLAGPAQEDKKRSPLADDVMVPKPGHRTLSGGWPVGSTIDVYFKNGSAARRTQFARNVSEWSKYGNFLLRFHQEAMPNNVYAVLVAFWDGGGVSLLGSGTYSNQHPSIYVPYNPGESPVDVHEFGHTLGLVHEFENPDSLRFITVNENTYKILQNGLGWDRQTADARLIKKVVPPGKEHAFDPVSCMGYQSEFFLPGLYKGIVMTPSATLSPGDKAFIAKLYPGKTSQAILPFAFTDEGRTPVEAAVKRTWKEQKMMLEVPASFQIHTSNPQMFAMANPAFTNQFYFVPGITSDRAILEARVLSINATYLNRLPLRNVAVTGGESASQKENDRSGIYFTADGIDQKGNPVKYFGRVIEFKYATGVRLTGYFLFQDDEVLKDQVSVMVSSSQPDAAPAATPTEIEQCGAWLETYKVRPHRSWGRLPGPLQSAWDRADCNHKVCHYLKAKYGVSSGGWGSLPADLRSVWTTPEIDCPGQTR